MIDTRFLMLSGSHAMWEGFSRQSGRVGLLSHFSLEWVYAGRPEIDADRNTDLGLGKMEAFPHGRICPSPGVVTAIVSSQKAF